MLFTIAVILLVLWAARAGQRIHTRQLHLCAARDRARAVRGRARQWPSDRLTQLRPASRAGSYSAGGQAVGQWSIGWPSTIPLKIGITAIF
jgi:hypothetical protein